MKYTEKKVKLITKLTTNSIYRITENDISTMFWYKIFNKEIFKDFITNKYIPYKVRNNTLDDRTVSDIKFCLLKLESVKEDVDLINKTSIEASDLFFSYILFEKMLSFFNDYYKDSYIKISILIGLEFGFDALNKIDVVFNDFDRLFLSGENQFLNEMVIPLYEQIIEEDKLYNIKIFWPSEIILVLLLGKLIKEKTKNSKVLLDVSEANEQLDYTQWSKLINENHEYLSKYVDFFVLYRNFGDSTSNICKYLNGEDVKLSNIILINNGKFEEFPFDNATIGNNIDKFLKSTFNPYNKFKFFGKNSTYARMFPYKCYWSKCNFCTINSQNFIKFDEKYGYDMFLDKWIEFIKENNIYQLIFSDEAMPPTQIVKFAKKVIENNLEIIYQFRTRFDKYYTKENCEILFKSGARYCGIGLESGSARINEEVGNKGERHISLKDKFEIIKNFDDAGISFHNYAIMGFPTETQEETLLTYKVLLKNIREYNYYTCTPNIYGLMKGSYIFNNLDKYGIKIEEKYLNNLLNLRFEFNYSNGVKRDVPLYKKLAERVHQEQFAPWLFGRDDVNIRGFWDYIDRSGYFYRMKMIYRKNPFRAFRNINNEVLKKDYEDILKSYFKISKALQTISFDNERIYFADLINLIEFNLPISYMNLVNNYNENISLIDNLNNNNIIPEKEDIYYLIENRIFLNISK